MKLNFAAPAASAMIIAAMAFSAPALAEETTADANAAAKCVVKKNGFAWNVCGAKELRGKLAPVVPGGAAPGGAGPNGPEKDEPKSISVFGISLGSGPTSPEPENGSNPYGGGADNGR